MVSKQLNLIPNVITLVIIKSKNENIFGGYTEQSWSNTDPKFEFIDKSDPNALIFSLIKKENRPLKIICSPNNGIRCNKSKCAIFGGNEGKSDLTIVDKFKISKLAITLQTKLIHF